jgi:hypothetical protein
MKNYKRSDIRKVLIKEFKEILKEQDIINAINKIEMNDMQTFTDPSVFDDNQVIMDQFTMLIEAVSHIAEQQVMIAREFDKRLEKIEGGNNPTKT